MSDNILTTSKRRLGANYNEKTKSIDFKLFSANAKNVILCIFEKPEGEDAVMNFEMKQNEDGIFETSVKIYALGNLKRPFYYGYRLFGENWVKDENWTPGTKEGFREFVDYKHNRFNPNKIAYDPYGLELSHLPSKYKKHRINVENYLEDNAKYAPKTVFAFCDDIEILAVSPRSLKDEIIGEVHIKDLTQLLNIEGKGTFKGAENFAKYLASLGLTMIEFLPLNEFDDEGNHWGYMPLGYFSLAKKYANEKSAGSSLNEFRKLIKAFHKEGLKVCMDMVFNHTGEAKIYDNDINDVNLMSYALIDNATYYKQTPDNYYTNYSCCNNDFNIANKEVQNLIIDSLEFWAKQGVDAFRFDLAAALMDKDSGFGINYDKNDGFIAHIKECLEKRNIHVLDTDEENYGIHLIAEPWGCMTSCAYQLGNFPSYWAEWSDISQNTIRANTISPSTTDPLGLRNLIEGIPFCFGENLKAINYITSHDGFTLNDLNSYTSKSPDTDCGSDWEICSDFLGNSEMQEKSIRKQIALLMISRGIPMIQIGDFVSHTKLGNNNSYNLDNEINYIDFSKINDKTSRSFRVFEFMTSMIKFRKAHKILTNKDYVKNIDYLGPNANIIPNDNLNYWQNKQADFLSFKTNGDDVIYCAISKANYSMEITLPINNYNKKWYFVLDTSKNQPVCPDGIEFEPKRFVLESNSVAIFIEK